MSRTVHINRRASRDLGELLDYVRHRSGSVSAERWADGILARIGTLKRDAEVWPLSENAGLAESDVREMLYRRSRFVYRIYYRIVGEEVFVHRIRSAFQDHLQPDDL